MLLRLRFTLIGLLLALLVLGPTRPGYGQSADQQKGRIWTITAKRVWADFKLKDSPPVWTTVREFENWLYDHPKDESELGSLRGTLIERVGPGQPATPKQLARAIIAEVSQRRIKKTGRLAGVNLAALETELEEFVSPATLEATDAVPDSVAPELAVAPSPAPPPAALAVAEAHNPQPEAPEVAATIGPGSGGAPGASYFEQHSYQTAALAGVLGLLLGLGLMALFRPKHHQQNGIETPSYQNDSATSMDDSERSLRGKLSDLTFKVAKLEKENNALHRENDELRVQLSKKPKALEPVLVPPVTAAEGVAADSEPTPVPPTTDTGDVFEVITVATASVAAPTVAVPPAPKAPAAPLTRYGPVQETPFLEERKLTSTPLAQLALMLTVQAQQPDQASFTLNPHVDQEMLIGDGLNRLQKFFDYEPPLGGRINSVKAAAPGRLQRQADGWQVVERARLIIT